MISTSSGITTSTALPYDLYPEIVENLHHPKDRRTLVSLSLVSKAWSEQSQRVLYMEFCDQWANGKDHDIVLARHTRFLCAIIDHPTRLGPHVRMYAQFWLASTVGEQDSVRLRGLTLEALPAMVNL